MRIIVQQLVLAACLVGQSTEWDFHKPYIVRISVLGSNNYNNCLIVLPDGRMHLELRRRDFFDGTAVLTTYESALRSKDVEVLRGILDEAEVRALPPFRGPVVIPKDVDNWQVFKAEVARDTGVQHVGYVTWQGHGVEPDNLAWNQAKIALHQLVHWSHDTELSKSIHWHKARTSDGFCGQ